MSLKEAEAQVLWPLQLWVTEVCDSSWGEGQGPAQAGTERLREGLTGTLAVGFLTERAPHTA